MAARRRPIPPVVRSGRSDGFRPRVADHQRSAPPAGHCLRAKSGRRGWLSLRQRRASRVCATRNQPSTCRSYLWRFHSVVARPYAARQSPALRTHDTSAPLAAARPGKRGSARSETLKIEMTFCGRPRRPAADRAAERFLERRTRLTRCAFCMVGSASTENTQND